MPLIIDETEGEVTRISLPITHTERDRVGGNKNAQAQTIANQHFGRWGVVGPWLTSSRSEAGLHRGCGVDVKVIGHDNIGRADPQSSVYQFSIDIILISTTITMSTSIATKRPPLSPTQRRDHVPAESSDEFY